MKTIDTNMNDNVASCGRWLLRALQSSAIGMILILAMPGMAQEMNKSRKGYEMSAQQQPPRPNPDLRSLDRLVSVNCETQEEIDEMWEKLTEGGEEGRCGWLKDKYGLSWQVNPTVLGEMLQDNDPEKAKRVMGAMLQMDKIDIETLKQAYEGR